ncbi:MAG: putative cytokinetic ring protein SteA [Nocardioidaceae bacterium]
MKLTSSRRSRTRHLPGVIGTARLSRRTDKLVKRIRPGDVAILDHVDIDGGAATALVEAGVKVVVNIAPSISGRYPNLGPQMLLDAGVSLVDEVGPEVFTRIREGETVRVDGDSIYKGETLIAAGTLQTRETVADALEASKEGMASQLAAFSANAMEHLDRERSLLLDGSGVPKPRTSLEGRQTLIVLRAFDYASDLATLKTYIRENSPVLIGVEAGADALLEAGYRPDLIVTDFDIISDKALRCGAEVVAHAPVGGRVKGSERIERMGMTPHIFETNGTAEDAAMLLAHFNSAALIVMVGSYASLLEFLDKGRSGMASSFLTRAAVGSSVVDAKAVAPLYQHRLRGWWALLLVVIALALVAAAIATTPVGQDWWNQVQEWSDDVVGWVREVG